jgi:hypothetical protein
MDADFEEMLEVLEFENQKHTGWVKSELARNLRVNSGRVTEAHKVPKLD